MTFSTYDILFSPDLGSRLACQHCSIIFCPVYIILKKSPSFKLYLIPVPLPSIKEIVKGM